ncbi:DDE-type integrase/transposase/recombinase [Zhongshania aliphaticivorans]|uniref:DDE-type integrase/transposase/recombinase n=1 Tax=Zhongshania aliphaticivorans TaxID=1470434 RepID=UPI0039C8E404
MPWHKTDHVSEREHFLKAWLTGRHSMTALCRAFGISRKTGHKWVYRLKTEGMTDLSDRSRARHQQTHQTPESITQTLINTKFAFPDWGPRKVVAYLRNTQPDSCWPAHSTVSEIFARQGLVKHRGNRRYKSPARTAPLSHASEPNRVWSVDFKGDFLLGNQKRCYPLTVFDNYSRYLLDCKGLYSTHTAPVIAAFERLFYDYGLPDYLRSDNGSPFASTRIGGLSQFSLWLLKRGVMPERIRPGQPQENGRHERFHRSLKAAVCKPPKGDLSAQQRAFNHYQFSYNNYRPHEALNDTPPAQHYTRSPRIYTGEEQEFHYPDHYVIRKVRSDGNMKWKQLPIYIANLLAGEYIGLEPIDEGCWMTYISTLKLGILDERQKRIIRPGQ